jgi:pimeloyl-ACP methyl ester carboxylesterase
MAYAKGLVMDSKKSTTVRIQSPAPGRGWARLCALIASISTAWAARLASSLYLRPPPRRRPRMREQLVLAAGQRLELGFQSTTLSVWRWGRGPVVLLVHGWGGSAGQLQSFVQPLVREGFTVVAFDAPGHGVSGGTWASRGRMAQAIGHVAQTVGPVHGVVAHGLGAAAVSLAVGRGLRLSRLVEIGPTGGPAEAFHEHAVALRLSEPVAMQARARVERRLGVTLERLDSEQLASAIELPVLVIHDRLDDEVPWSEGLRTARALPRGRLMTTLGLGHLRIVDEPAVIDAACRFIDRDRPPVRANAPSFGALAETLRVPA